MCDRTRPRARPGDGLEVPVGARAVNAAFAHMHIARRGARTGTVTEWIITTQRVQLTWITRITRPPDPLAAL